MSEALGQLKNAPLIYVLAQVVFTRVPKMGNLWEDFHQTIFEQFPETSVKHIRKINLSDADESATNETQWGMFSPSKTEGVLLGSDNLVFHATSYVTSKEFFEKLSFVVSQLSNLLPDKVQVSRLGIRYVDLLLPMGDLSVDEQVTGKLGSISLKKANCEFDRLEEITTYKTAEGGSIVIRHRQSNTSDILPGDIFPNDLEVPARLSNPKPEGEVVGLLDFDHYVYCSNTFAPTEVIEQLKTMHDTSSQAFRLTTTSEARKLWGEGE